jgi:hypothetical protein
MLYVFPIIITLDVFTNHEQNNQHIHIAQAYFAHN